MERFLTTLIESGQPVLSPGKQRAENWVSQQIQNHSGEAIKKLKELHESELLNLPGTPLGFDEQAALCGLQTLFIMTAATAFREIEISQVKSWLKETAIPILSPEAHFSADLCLQYLSDLHKTVAEIADGDPLLHLFEKIGAKLPLSSVGIPMESLPDLAIFNKHSGLAQFHVERVITRSDFPRASHPGVSSLIKTMVGMHHKILIPDFPIHTS